MGGYQQLVRGDVMRGKFRNSFEKPEPFEPGKPTRVKFRLQDIYHTFRPGHRIMVQVQSSWFPLVDRNPQKFVDIYSAKESDFQKATQRVYRSRELAVEGDGASDAVGNNPPSPLGGEGRQDAPLASVRRAMPAPRPGVRPGLRDRPAWCSGDRSRPRGSGVASVRSRTR